MGTRLKLAFDTVNLFVRSKRKAPSASTLHPEPYTIAFYILFVNVQGHCRGYPLPWGTAQHQQLAAGLGVSRRV